VGRSKLRLKEKMNTRTLSFFAADQQTSETLNGAFFSCSLGAIEESRHVSLMIRTNSLSWVQRWMCRINESIISHQSFIITFQQKDAMKLHEHQLSLWFAIQTSWSTTTTIIYASGGKEKKNLHRLTYTCL